MFYQELIERIDKAKQNWEAIKEDLGKQPSLAEFLEDSYLVLANPYLQVPPDLTKNLHETVLKEPGLLKQSVKNNEAYIRLCRELEAFENRAARADTTGNKSKRTEKELNNRRQEISLFDSSSLEFVDDLTVELRFPKLKIDVIQSIKQHPLVDREETMMSAASIRVVISSR